PSLDAGPVRCPSTTAKTEPSPTSANDSAVSLIGTKTEVIDDGGTAAAFENMCNSFTKKALILRADTVGGGLAAKIDTNVFKHMDACFGLFEIAKSLKTFLDFGRLLIGVTARTIGPGRSGSRSSPDRVRRKKGGLKNARQDFAVHIFRHRYVE